MPSRPSLPHVLHDDVNCNTLSRRCPSLLPWAPYIAHIGGSRLSTPWTAGLTLLIALRCEHIPSVGYTLAAASSATRSRPPPVSRSRPDESRPVRRSRLVPVNPGCISI